MNSFFFFFLQLTAATDRINSLREEQEQLRKENETILQSSQKKEEVKMHLNPNSAKPLPNLKNIQTICGVFAFPGSTSRQPGGAGDVQTNSTGPG